MTKVNEKTRLRSRRKKRTRKKINGTPERPRLSIFRSSKHILCQVVDDIAGKTLLSIHSYAKGQAVRASKAKCTELGKKLAEECKAKNIATMVFDKNGFRYHGRIKAFADGLREGGIKF